MKKLIPLILIIPCFAMGASLHAARTVKAAPAAISSDVAAAGPVTGTVKDETGAALAGVSVALKGTTTGTQTDANGHFRLNASPGDVLVFTYIGYQHKEVTVGNNTNYEIALTADEKSLNEIVVTALGVKKQEQALSYDQQVVSGKELQTAKDPSFVNSLAGKVAGVTIDRSSSGAGGSTKVVLRGEKSINGSNNVLYVVDGIPLNNFTTDQPNGVFAYVGDGGDGISNINPDDIESMTVLKGASAAALYGSAAQNGAIVITTKKGRAGRTTVNFSSSTMLDKATSLPNFQNEYGQGDIGVSDKVSLGSWGAKTSGTYYDPADWFNTGHTLINAVDLSTGTEKSQTFASYANTNSDGIEPGNTYNKNNFSLRNTSQFYNGKIELDGGLSYIGQYTKDRSTSGTYFNPLTGLYLFPRGADFTQYSKYEVYDPTRNISVQNWPFPNLDYQQNPYWVQYRDPTDQRLSRFMGNLGVKWNIADWINFQVRGKIDHTDLLSNQYLYATTTSVLSGPNGSYVEQQTTIQQIYADALLNINKKFASDFSLNATLGASLENDQSSGQGINGWLGIIDNYFNANNLNRDQTTFNQTSPSTAETQSLFASADLTYKDMLTLEVTGRNDWSSTLAFTPNVAFFYPSVGLSAVLSKMLKMPDFVSFSKLRASYAGVGNGAGTFQTLRQGSESNGASAGLSGTLTLNTLKPEHTNSFEIGTEWRFFQDALSFDATYYNTKTTNQLFNVAASSAALGYSNYYLNGGDVQNKGFEGTLGYTSKFSHNFSWNSSFIFSYNTNKVLNLYSTQTASGPVEVNNYALPGNFDSYGVFVVKGKPFGEIYARGFQRDASGKILTDSNGLPLLQNNPNGDVSGFTDVGNANPKVTLGWNNTFKFNNFDLSFLVDGRFGGTVLDMTGAYLDYYGVTQATAQARDNGGVDVNGKKIDAETYYHEIGLRGGALAEYAYSATNIRLRELAFGYTFPSSLFHNTVKTLRIGLQARNLFFLYKKAPYDPDVALATDNSEQGIDVFGQPTYRSYGFNLSVGF